MSTCAADARDGTIGRKESSEMSQQELSDFFESCRRVFTLIFPFLLVGLVTSFVDFLQKHLGKERFKLTKLIVGVVSDMFLAFVITCIGYEIGLGEFGIAARDGSRLGA